MKRNLLFILAMIFMIASVSVHAQTISPISVNGGNGGLKPRQVESINSSGTGLSVVAYYTVWSYCDMPPQDVDYSAITHLVLFGGASSGITPNVNTVPYFPPATPGNNSFSTTFTGTPGWCANPIAGKNHVQIMRDSCNAHGVKLLLDLGGEYGTPASAFQALIADTTKYDAYINAVDSITRHNVYGVQFDGVSIDWEFPNTQGSASVHTAGSPLYNYDLFLKKLWTKLQTWTPSPGIIGEAFPTWFWWNHSTKTGPIVDTSTIRKYISLVNLMEYGMENTSAISHYSPLYANPAVSQETWDFRGVNEWSGAGVAKSQINTLIPFESIKMTDNSGISPVAIGHAGGSASWIGIRDIPSGVTVHYDSVSKCNWAETGKSLYSYENAASLAAKVQYARSKNIGGVGVWELWRGWLPNAPAGQHDPLLQELKAAVGGIVIPPDTIKPAVSINSPVNGSTVSGVVSLIANASDNVGVTRVEFWVNGSLAGSSASSPYSLQWNTSGLSGSITLQSKAYDAAGNIGISLPISVTVNNTVADTSVPLISIVSPTNGANVSGSVSISVTATDNVGVTKVDFLINGVTVGSDSAKPYVYNWNTTNQVGSNVLSAKAHDAAGNIGTAQAITVTVALPLDTIPPTVAIVSPTSGASVSGTVTVNANASAHVKLKGVQFNCDGANIGSMVTASPFSCAFNSTLYSNGTHTITATAQDTAGLVNNASVNVTVSNTITTNSPISPNFVRDNFDTSANRLSIAGRNKWINIANQTGKGTLQIYNNAVQPYNKNGIGTYGGVAWDSLMNAGSQIGVVVRQKGGNGSNASFFIYVRMTNENLSTGNGYRLRYLSNPNGVDQLSLERVSKGVNAVTLCSMNREILTGDTLSVRINNDAAHSLVVYIDRDSVLASKDTVYNPSSWYVWLRGCVFRTPVRVDNFMIANLAQLPSTIFSDPTNSDNGLPAPKGQTIPQEFSLFQNYPNPFNPSTRIQFVVPNPSVVTLKIYNLLGQEVSTLVDNETMDAGAQTVEFNASQFSSGVYFYRIIVNQFASPDDGIAPQQFTSLRKMMLVK